MKNHKPPLHVYIAADSRSGSTLLDLLLGNHSRMVSIGELRRLHEHFNGHYACSCEKVVYECPFWLDVEKTLNEDGRTLQSMQTLIPTSPTPLLDLVYGLPLNLLRRLAKRASTIEKSISIAENGKIIIRAVAQAVDCSIVVDSSKVPKGARLAYLLNPSLFKVIFLVRDGRGIVNSRMKHSGISIKSSVLAWIAYTLKSALLWIALPGRCRHVVKYEALCRDPVTEIRSICEFIGIPFEEGAAQLVKKDKHNICGSPMRFERDNTEIRLDENWRTTLTSRELTTFRNLGGALLNRLLGYR